MEDTQKKQAQPVDPQNEALIQEMLRSAKPFEVEGELTRNPIIHKGDKELEAPMVVNTISSAGYVWIWETDTYEKVPCLYYMLPSKLRSKRKDGSYRFTTIDPGIKPTRGTIKCMLHEKHPNRPHYKEIGFRTCPKTTITSQYQLEQHMKKRHPQEWAAITKEKTDMEREEDRALQRLILSQMKPKEPEPVPVAVVEEPKPVHPMMPENSYWCTGCNKPHLNESGIGKEHIKFKE